MALEPAITDMQQLKDHPELAALLAWDASAVTGAKFDRRELTIWVDRIALRGACSTLKNDPKLPAVDPTTGRIRVCATGTVLTSTEITFERAEMVLHPLWLLMSAQR